MFELILDKLSKKVKKGFLSYCLGLILNKEKNTCTKMSEWLGLDHNILYRFLEKTKLLLPLFPILMVTIVKYFYVSKKKSWLIIDDTTLCKTFARKLIGVYKLFNTALGRVDRGLCLVVISWTNGEVTIPIRFLWYFSKDITGKHFKTKSQLAEELILKLKGKIPFDALLIDGHYTTQYLIKFMVENGIDFVGKIAKNRIIETKNGIKARIDEHPDLKLHGNQRTAKVRAKFAGKSLYFAVHKRKNDNGDWTYLYLVSNINLKAKEYFKVYKKRWKIEKKFRTFKQSLGFADCASRSLEKQELHVFAIFFSYAFLQKEKKDHSLKNPEAARKQLSKLKSSEAMDRIVAFSENFGYGE